MTNKKLEELIRIENASRYADEITVEFMYSQGYYAIYKVVTYISVDYVVNIREQLVVEKQGKIANIIEIADWCDRDGRPNIPDDVWYNQPDHLIYGVSLEENQ